MSARPSPRSHARSYLLTEPTPERAAWPPPHDPRERELLTTVEGWEVRIFNWRVTTMKRIEKAFVSDLVRAQGRPVS